MKELIGNLLGASFAGVNVKIWLAIIAALGLVAFVVIEIADNRDRRMIETAKGSGAIEAISAGHRTTLQQSGAANEAGNQVRDNRGNARFDECLRSATAETRVNCERFRNEPLPD